MTSPLRVFLRSCVATCVIAGASLVYAQQTAAPPKAPAPAARRPATKEAAHVPAIKGNPDEANNSFLKRHENFLKDLAAKNGKVGVLFVGDSITDGWRGGGKEVFQKAYGELDPL